MIWILYTDYMSDDTKCILIVEDEVDIRDAIAEAIRDVGYEVLLAADGKQGLELALREHPDLILLDLVMPVMDGHEMLRLLRDDEWGKAAKVIVLTASFDVSDVAEAHTGEIIDYIIKVHASLDEVVNKVRLAIV